MNIDFEKTAKLLSRGLTALVSMRALLRSGIGIQKILKTSKSTDAKAAPAAPAKKDDKKQKQLQGALIGMGYNLPEVDRTVKELFNKLETDTLPDLVREALGILNNKG